MSRLLEVYLHDLYAGQLIQEEAGELSFVYDPAYVSSNRLALSLSLPLQSEVYRGSIVKAFFSGFLPEETARHKIARYLGVSDKNPFALLEIIGGECAGAVSLYPEGNQPPKIQKEDIVILDHQQLKEVLELLKRRPLLVGEEGFRLSLAGAHDKLAVGVCHNQIALVRGATPTTHIIKPPIPDIEDTVQNEFFCMRLAALMGIDTPAVEMRTVDNIPYFIVKRYDREQDDRGNIRRIHQEDFCQALSIMPDRKYEREGGPTLKQCQMILQQHSQQPAADQMSLIVRLIFNYLVGNADAHGKNFSLLYKNKQPIFTPVYDLLSTAVYPEFSSKMAMKIGGKYDPEEVLIRHWHDLVPGTITAKRSLEKQLIYLSKKCLENALSLKINLNQEGIESNIFDRIIEVIQKRSAWIEKQIIL